MKAFFKLVGILIVVVAALTLVAAAFVYFRSERIQKQTYPLPSVSIQVPTSPQALARGEHLARVISDCTGCHGRDFGGGVVVDDPALGRVVAPNLTTGQGGFGAKLSDEDIARVLRFGILPDGRSVFVMPSDDYSHMSDEDLGALIAYLRSLPPVDQDLGQRGFRALGRILLAVGQLPIVMVNRIDPGVTHPVSMPAAVSQEYGRYLGDIAGCSGCHGPGLSGGAILGAPPDWPKAANLTPSGEIIGWSEADFIKVMTTGVTPGGRELSSRMPYKTYVNMTQDELRALWLFVKSVPSRPAGTR